MFLPSIGHGGSGAPVIAAMVGSRSIVVTTSFEMVLLVMRSGQRMMPGTRCPPSNVVHLPSRSGPAEPASLP